MNKVMLSKPATKKTVDGKNFDDKNILIPESHVISSSGKTLKGVGMKNPDPKTIKAGTIEIFDDETLVIQIDRVNLATGLASLIASYEVNGVKKVYNTTDAMIPIGYTQKGQLTVKGNYNDLVFYFTEKKP